MSDKHVFGQGDGIKGEELKQLITRVLKRVTELEDELEADCRGSEEAVTALRRRITYENHKIHQDARFLYRAYPMIFSTITQYRFCGLPQMFQAIDINEEVQDGTITRQEGEARLMEALERSRTRSDDGPTHEGVRPKNV